MADTIICNCAQITKEQIEAEIKAGAKTVEEIGEKTGAGTICGVCVEDIEAIIEENK